MNVPPIADAFIEFTDGQKSALAALEMAGNDEDARRDIRYHLDAWDRHFGRESTIALRDRKRRAERVWEGHIYSDGGGI